MESSTTPFPILKLPFVPAKNIIRSMEVYDIIDFSLSSKKSKTLTKMSLKRNTIKVNALFREDPIVYYYFVEELKNKERPFVLRTGFMSRRNHLLYENEELQNCGNDIDEMRSVWIRAWTDHMCNIFSCTVYSINIHSDHCLGKIARIVNWINSRQPFVEICEFIGYKLIDEELKLLIDTCKIRKSFRYSLAARPYEIKPIHPKFETDYLFVRGDLSMIWISIADIISSNCIHFNLGSFRFTETDINCFLKAWISGSNHRMKYFHIHVPLLNHEQLIDGIEVEEVDDTVKRSYIHLEKYELCVFEGGTNVRRSDGTVATFKQFTNNVVGYRSGIYSFAMAVWK